MKESKFKGGDYQSSSISLKLIKVGYGVPSFTDMRLGFRICRAVPPIQRIVEDIKS